ncbi:Spc97/Spc98 family protein [Xylaria bambusicola]|uniref:Spc97/Spc98 family protein n=1 Tax=Xylaria bambusicola TaxID=326684 RepID=UPI002007C2BA|nr:Spc97/Spc98 family protein [Xylaria bambusicola]KAI0503370.1 Spc97/Spc98 family protein [Xylaria bambusicola]
MAFAARLSSLTDEVVELITSTTAEVDRRRFDAFRESSLRQLRQHSFLRTNHFEVYSALDGYEERFRILNRDQTADALRDRLDALARCSNKWAPDSLDLLLRLADQPVQKSNLLDLELLKEPEVHPEPALKWRDIAKEDGWKEDHELWRNVNFGGDSSDEEYDHESDASAQSEDTSLSSGEARYRKQPTDYLERPQVQFDIHEIRTSQAWRTDTSRTNPGASSHKIDITQIQCIREILFMLSGLENGLFDSQGQPSLGIQLSHSSWQIFRSLLVPMSDARRRLSLLRKYARQQQQIPLLQAFQAAIESRLRAFDSTIASMQAYYVSTNQDFVASVLKLLDDLNPHIRPLESLAETVERLEQARNSYPFHCLELLYDSAQELQLNGNDKVYRFIGQLFFECFAVYLRPIRCWMEEGELMNSDETFFICRSLGDVSRSQIWADQFKLKRTLEGSLFAPRFLQPAASKIFTTGKSIVILKLLGKCWPTQQRTLESAIQVDMSAISIMMPFSEAFEQMFEEWMQSKHHAASATLRQTLFQTYNLWSDLTILQHIYLMSDGSRSEHFANAVFNNIDILNVNWHDRFNLTEIAREAFDRLVEPHRLNVTALQNNSSLDVKSIRRTVREGLPCICITYRLPWLSRIVLSDESLEQYQRVFTLLLQLRRASYVLTRHRILSEGIVSTTVEQETFYSLRSKLLWFCNTLQSYLSTLVIGPLVVKLSGEMKKAEGIDQMLTLHSTFTKRIVDEACLGGKLDPIRQAILDIFDLAVRLRNAHQVEQEKGPKENELSRSLIMSSSEKGSAKRYVQASEEEDDTFLIEQDTSGMMQGAEIPYGQVLGEIRSDLDRHIKFVCGGLRGVARASSSDAASKWDILAEMLEPGIRVLH